MSNIPWHDSVDLATVGQQKLRAKASEWRARREARRARRAEIRAQRAARVTQAAGLGALTGETATILHSRTIVNDPPSSMAFFR
jgi:hypothetical protein